MTQATEKDIGKWCKFVYDDLPSEFTIGKLWKISEDNGEEYFYNEDTVCGYEFCTPLTQEQIKVLGLE